MLFMAMDAGVALLTSAEALPDGQPAPPPGKRETRVKHAGITSDDGIPKSHLMTFAEFCTMYLFAWSPVLWQPEFPTFKQVLPNDSESFEIPQEFGPPVELSTEIFNNFSTEVAQLTQFRSTLEVVRKALANVPTYMICDDHEVTDDWFLDRA